MNQRPERVEETARLGIVRFQRTRCKLGEIVKNRPELDSHSLDRPVFGCSRGRRMRKYFLLDLLTNPFALQSLHSDFMAKAGPREESFNCVAPVIVTESILEVLEINQTNLWNDLCRSRSVGQRGWLLFCASFLGWLILLHISQKGLQESLKDHWHLSFIIVRLAMRRILHRGFWSFLSRFGLH